MLPVLRTNIPLDSMLLSRVRRWVEVVFRQRTACGQLDPDGRPWTRCPAKDLARQLEEQDGLVVSVRRIQRSLARLEAEGYLARQQRGIWRRDFWYSFPDAEWELQKHRPTALANASAPSPKVSPAREPRRRQQASRVTGENLDIPSSNQNLSKTKRKVAPRLDGESGVSVAKGAYKGQQGGSKGFGQVRGEKSTGNPLKALVERACALGGKPFETEWEPTVHGNRWIEHGYVFTRLESGQVVVDSLETAPLR